CPVKFSASKMSTQHPLQRLVHSFPIYGVSPLHQSHCWRFRAPALERPAPRTSRPPESRLAAASAWLASLPNHCYIFRRDRGRGTITLNGLVTSLAALSIPVAPAYRSIKGCRHVE